MFQWLNIVDFRELAAESGWGDEALQGVFVHGLADYVKDELAARDSASSLDESVSLAIRLDNCLRERRREKPGSPPAPIFHPQARPSLPFPVERASSSRSEEHTSELQSQR